MPSIGTLLASANLPGDSPRLDAELLLAHCLEQTRAHLYAWPERIVSDTAVVRYQAMLQARREGCPVAYLLGEKEFWSLALSVDERALIPRPDTEVLVNWALQLDLPVDAQVADWGTGSGAIALALASERPAWQLMATDVSAAALSLAEENCQRLQLVNVDFKLSDWGVNLEGLRLDMIVSNPPYIAETDTHLAAAEVQHEPRSALVSGADGLDALRCIVACAPALLVDNGYLLLEHGWEQGAAVRQLLHSAGFNEVETRTDIEGRDRISGGRWRVQT